MARYIDAERLINEISGNGGVFVYGVKVVAAMVSRINAQPTADVVEVKHGKWLKNNTECSVCKALNPTMYLNEYDLKYKALPLPHCPICCAKMDGR